MRNVWLSCAVVGGNRHISRACWLVVPWKGRLGDGGRRCESCGNDDGVDEVSEVGGWVRAE